MNKGRYIMIGGFLGAGKTTTILQFAGHLAAAGKRVGLITNDQSVDLVDTARARAAGFAVEEITGGCFCCKFNSLLEASQQLTRQTAPDVLIAEPVGSCTDLQATVSYPLRQLYGDSYEIAPLAVLVDPIRCERILGLETGKNFSDKVLYVYRKQLEEAEILVINKIDLLPPERLPRLRAALAAAFPEAAIREISARSGDGLAPFFGDLLGQTLGRRHAMDVDYDLYADGEALLGWLNARTQLSAPAPFDGNALLLALARDLRRSLAAENIEIAHLKMTLAPDEGPDLAALSLTRSEADPQPTHTLQAPLAHGDLVLNLRAEADPDLLQIHVLSALQNLPVSAAPPTLTAFRPGRPNPTHRIAEPT